MTSTEDRRERGEPEVLAEQRGEVVGRQHALLDGVEVAGADVEQQREQQDDDDPREDHQVVVLQPQGREAPLLLLLLQDGDVGLGVDGLGGRGAHASPFRVRRPPTRSFQCRTPAARPSSSTTATSEAQPSSMTSTAS